MNLIKKYRRRFTDVVLEKAFYIFSRNLCILCYNRVISIGQETNKVIVQLFDVFYRIRLNW
jgi:hypothetical protein